MSTYKLYKITQPKPGRMKEVCVAAFDSRRSALQAASKLSGIDLTQCRERVFHGREVVMFGSASLPAWVEVRDSSGQGKAW